MELYLSHHCLVHKILGVIFILFMCLFAIVATVTNLNKKRDDYEGPEEDKEGTKDSR